MTRPKILHVAAVEYTVRHLLLPQMSALAEAGFDVAVACAPEGDRFTSALEPFHPEVVRFPKFPEPIALTRAMSALRRVIGRLQPDLVHFHTPTASIPGRAALAWHRSGPPVVLTVHGFLHDWEYRGPSARVSEVVERLLSRVTDMSLFQSKEDLREAQRHRYCGLLRYLGNGVQDEWFSGPRTALHRSGALRAVCVARLIRMKGVLDLLVALRDVDGIELTLVGYDLENSRDPIGNEARAAVADLRVPVRFTGKLEPSGVREQLESADLFVLPSWREGVPRSIIEAMATGLPVVATSIKGNRELVTQGENGWLVPPRAPAALADALRQAVSAPAGKLLEMGRVSFERAAAEYREAEVFGRIIAAYGELGVRP